MVHFYHLFAVVAVLSFSSIAVDAELTLRLFGGATSQEGRLEVYYNGQWGSVCDDNWDNSYCSLVCTQLAYTGGVLVSADKYGTFSGNIWLDDIKCHGTESSLDQCDRGFWGNHNCNHNEDVGCTCDEGLARGAGCNAARHRILPWDVAYPWMGRVEIQTEDGRWGTVCDDLWTDTEAHVLCTCLGFTDSQYFRAYWSREMTSLSPLLPMLYDSVSCTSRDCANPANLWDCPNKLNSGRCDPVEAAAVSCGPVPQSKPPGAPDVKLECESELLTVCFTSEEYSMESEFLSVNPDCIATKAYNVQDGVCIQLDMNKCNAAQVHTDMSSKHYCYDVTYSEFDTDPATLLVDSIWRRTACCSVAKNGSVANTFGSHMPQASDPVFVEAPTTFSLDCFLDKSFSGEPLVFPVNVTRGQELFCRVSAHAWDPKMFLVVPECEFRASLSGPPSYTFLIDKCPVSEDLDASYFNIDHHNWGVKFEVPKFQGYDSLYLQCTTYICDSSLDDKPYCDRSCKTNSLRRRRSASLEANILHPGMSNSDEHVDGGPFIIHDDGFGPLLTVSTGLHNIHAPQSIHVINKTPKDHDSHSPGGIIDNKNEHRHDVQSNHVRERLRIPVVRVPDVEELMERNENVQLSDTDSNKISTNTINTPSESTANSHSLNYPEKRRKAAVGNHANVISSNGMLSIVLGLGLLVLYF